MSERTEREDRDLRNAQALFGPGDAWAKGPGVTLVAAALQGLVAHNGLQRGRPYAEDMAQRAVTLAAATLHEVERLRQKQQGSDLENLEEICRQYAAE